MKLPAASAPPRRLPPHSSVGAFVASGFDVGFDALAMHRRNDRPHLGIRIETVADANLLRPLDEALDETVVQRLFEEQSRTRRADLPGVGEDAEERVVDRGLEIGIGKDDVRRFSAEFERDFLEVARARLA